MTIVINTQSNTAYTSFIIDSFKALAQQKLDGQFIFLSTASIDNLPDNCKVVMVKKNPKTKIALQYWHNYKIPSLLKKLNATHYFNVDGIISKRTNITQYIFLALPVNNDRNILPKHLQRYYGDKAAEKLGKAKQIITFTKHEKDSLDKYFPTSKSNVVVLPLAVNPLFTALFWERQEEVKEKYTDGSSFFLAHYNTITKEEFTTLLKAFTQFKLWQKSSMKLVIYSPTISYQIEDLLSSYKYKADVLLMQHLPQQEYATILASAYAFIFADTHHYLPLPVLEALQCQVPTIISNQLSILFTDKSAMVNFNDIKSIAGELILLYKDENYRDKLIQESVLFTENYNWDHTIEKLTKIVL